MRSDPIINLRRIHRQEEAGRINDASRLANELQKGEGLTRTQALREAERLQAKHGLGLSVSYSPDPDDDPDPYPCRHSRFTRCRRCMPDDTPDISYHPGV